MNSDLQVLLVGAHGQVARACVATAPAGVRLRALSRAELDVTDADRVSALVSELRPDLIINGAAYTSVDRAEAEHEAARTGNVESARALAAAAVRLPHTRLLHLSTDYVFDGSASSPYAPEASTSPLGVYGATKLESERVVRETLAARAVVLRTSWVYSATGQNFLRTMLRVMARGEVRVVADQVGSPTAAHSLARAIWRIAALPEVPAVMHWTDAGVASWFDFAVAIAEEAAGSGLVPANVRVVPITTAEYPTAARRPSFSVLDKSSTIAALGITPPHWRVTLREVLKQLEGLKDA